MRILHQTGAKKDSNAHVVVWLTPLDRQVAVAPMQHVRLIQRDKRFIPHLIVITAGTKVEFPNEDPFFHNVFSLYKGKRFDLGLYEAGTSRSVEFDRPGVSFIFCNIHPEMSGLVLVLDTPYFAQSDKTGDITIRGVPPGKYRVEVWFERSSEEALNRLSRDISLPAQRELGTLDIPEVVPENVPHKNKYGNDYDQNELYKQ
jgi:plastocyanin